MSLSHFCFDPHTPDEYLNEKDFLSYVKDGNLSSVKGLVERGAVNLPIVPALQHASKYSDISMVEYLIAVGADVGATDGEGSTLLHLSASVGNMSNVKYVYEVGGEMIDVNAINNNGESPLSLAARNGHISVVQFLIEKGASVDIVVNDNGNNLLIDALLKGNVDLANLFIISGANTNARDTSDDIPALTIAVKSGLLETTKLLLDYGADVESLGPLGETALFSAARDENLDIMRMLLDNGAKADQSNTEGLLPREVTNDKIIKTVLGKTRVCTCIG